ncbi:trimeric intracellular cation channel family protein [Flavobacterium franklandianum]|uniref:Trimeric intracellular cation channel family protein n=1 Tax=Flavobacterium franklandianum TaxID=2594430 RepID=A0A553C7U5_9FLAO|nr:trimeric intracellular cation channel family protein [Flavobacterium franklandianum]TRX16597.1 trimeric intracellular cation channel family protein [Flavobacterium franklandianum]TRX24619.1 trimeric intracellular cation channel family protein [Flavobacterium franklandianum]
MFHLLDIIGTMAFAMSGALTAMHKKLDPFGVFIIAFVTAVGGGTLRDIMIGRTPVGWMLDVNYVYVIVVGFILAILFRKKFDSLRTSLFFFDTIGLGVFTLIGLEKGINIGLHPAICIALGTLTACFGGVIRDILCTEIPVIFRKEIYATICIFGGIVFFMLRKLNLDADVLYLTTSLFIISIRLMAVKFKWHLSPLSYK